MTHELHTERVDVQSLKHTPIGEVSSVAGWKDIPFRDTEKNAEPLVPIGIFSDHRIIFSSSVYANEHHNSPYTGGLEGSMDALFVRQGVAEKLDTAAGLLPRGCHLMAMDAYRTLEVQEALFSQYERGLRTLHSLWSDDEILTEAQKYVSIPSRDPRRPSPHNTGASVDVVLVQVPQAVQVKIDSIDRALASSSQWQREYVLEMKRSELLRRNAHMLNFGTPFDHGGPEAALEYYEERNDLTSEEQEIVGNRRLLFHVMHLAGFEPYADEWWHYNDPSSQMGAKVADREFAEYGAIELSDANKEFAEMRRLHRHNSVRLSRGEDWLPPKGLEEHYRLARQAIRGDNPMNIWGMTSDVAKIEPPRSAS